ncbi:hypothetical protein TIFTF001_054937 [Ficus carica]|uniref:ABC transmembrane type-1 domain-containing protein n=1 Tax=Ficus carica TaxID=3494 RepID=A0AA88JEH9_FICCA|nr:hypothetical protein TIFTF001_054937 [Ficus carica]
MKNLFSHLIHQEIALYDVTRTGELLSRLPEDTQITKNAATTNLSEALRNITTAFIGIGFMFSSSWRLTLLALVVVPVVSVAVKKFGRYLRALSHKTQAAAAVAASIAEPSPAAPTQSPGSSSPHASWAIGPSDLTRTSPPPARSAAVSPTQSGQPEICNFGHPLLVQQYVGGLDVAVDDGVLCFHMEVLPPRISRGASSMGEGRCSCRRDGPEESLWTCSRIQGSSRCLHHSIL